MEISSRTIGSLVTVIYAVPDFVTPLYLYVPVTIIVLETCAVDIETRPDVEIISFVLLEISHDLVPPVIDVPCVEYAYNEQEMISPGAAEGDSIDRTTEPRVGVSATAVTVV